MSDELSRVKSRQNKRNRENASGAKASRPRKAEASSPRTKEASSQTLSRSRRKNADRGKSKAAQRKTGTGRGGRRADRPKPGEGEQSPPSRSAAHRSERIRLSKLFVNSLNVLFMLLLIFLLWWGIKGAPPLQTLW
ncbi:cobalamin biosynthesis Mg chelatase CobN [Paenibacillus forsythiae]|uniref:Cobalamin biosynthesis Mg chelatase CobN n=1 Tax=Paenibacillus forsythiae TaxID=365616 RepID=A0ABU3H7P1_9BACL|nr:hypothetical protein [Paenibacillus forsythiae]MDT3426848.1 cobalamin biosynthesis Mg chelatase CobN [Paenibacillus forsythiae]